MNDSEVEALNQAGVERAELEDWGAAESYFRQAAAAGYSPALYNLGSLFERLGRWDGAVEYYERSAEKGVVDAYVQIAHIREEKLNDKEGARSALITACNLGDTDALVNLGIMHEESGQEDVAIELYRAAVDKGDVSALWLLGGAL